MKQRSSAQTSGANPPARLVVLMSGDGVDLQAVLEACASGELNARVVAVISDEHKAAGVQTARRAGLHTAVLPRAKGEAHREYAARLADLVASFHPDWVVLSGWDKIPGAPFLSRFPNRILHLHPALPSAFPGSHAVERAFYAFCRDEIDHTGVMVQLLSGEGDESGPILGHEQVPIEPDDTIESLEARVRAAGGQLLVATLKQLVNAHADAG